MRRKITVDPKKRPAALWILLCLLIFECISAVPYGLMLSLDPTGGLAKMPVEMLEGTIFHNFLIPGLILLIILGFGSFFIAVSLFLLPAWTWTVRLNPFRHQHWTWIATVVFGFALMTWIIVQVVMIGFDSWLQALHFGIGLAITLLSLQPSMLRHLKAR